MKKTTIMLLITIVLGCNKNNGNSGGNSNQPNTSSNYLDDENYVIVDGVTNYHYTYYPQNITPFHPIICQNNMYFWKNLNTGNPDYNSGVMLNNIANSNIQVYHTNNGVNTQYNKMIKSPLPTKITNNKVIVEFSNFKMYEGIAVPQDKDTLTTPFKYTPGKITCNGK